jgi:predicted NBD/HSP70 family sugar kinase
LQRASAGDARALAIVDDLCRVMGRTLYNLVVTLDLQRISLGGSVFWQQPEYLLPRCNPCCAANCPRSPTAATWCRPAWGPRGRLRGAGAAGLKHLRDGLDAGGVDPLADLLTGEALLFRL